MTGELGPGNRSCRWEAALLSYRNGVLSTTGAQPVAGAPQCKAPHGAYNYRLNTRDRNVLVRTSTAGKGSTSGGTRIVLAPPDGSTGQQGTVVGLQVGPLQNELSPTKRAAAA
ncbi:hypothetical protein SSPIM334S_06009 [Streptomyces spiroverticillatus]|uniref:hypothetical protein n=1 Tax=Streptomyces finlayi TaxID=67296 RepID=UPI001673548D|nr:hypothetical protein [Streptomyces finlayi]